MTLAAFEVIAKSEKKARSYLRRFCWHNRHVFCARCRSRKSYRIRGRRYRCGRCGYTFHDFSNRWINKVKVPYKTWLWILKLFELEVSAKEIAHEVGISYPTALKAVYVIRASIAAADPETDELLKSEAEPGETCLEVRRKATRGRGALDKLPVFGILEKKGMVKVSLVRDVTADLLLGMTVNMARHGSIVYTDKFRSYDALMFCNPSRGNVRANGLEGFWDYAEQRVGKSQGISEDKFSLYLKEIEFRYNNKNENIFAMLAQNICGLMPSRVASSSLRRT